MGWADLVSFTDKDTMLYGIGQMTLIVDANGNVLRSFPKLPGVLMRDRAFMSLMRMRPSTCSRRSMGKLVMQ